MTLQLNGVARSIKRAAELQERVRRDEVLEPTGRDLTIQHRDRVAVEDGTLRGSLRHSVVNGKLRVGATRDGWYWRFVEFGTDQHTIVARRQRISKRTGRRTRSRKGALVLAAGGKVFGTRIQHPGARPSQFIRPVIDESRRRMTRTLIRQLKDAARFR